MRVRVRVRVRVGVRVRVRVRVSCRNSSTLVLDFSSTSPKRRWMAA